MKTRGSFFEACVAILFGLPFFAGGLLVSGLYFSQYWDWWRTHKWVETPCWIDSTDLQESHDSRSGTSYQIEASYHYQFDGRTYQSKRVRLHGGSIDGDISEQDAYRELKQHQGGQPDGVQRDPVSKTASPFPCYVNPSNPDEAVLFRNFRFGVAAFLALFVLTFPIVGTAFVVGGMIAIGRLSQEKQLRKLYPDTPWKWKAIWAKSAIPDGLGPWRITLCLYTIWAGLVIIPLLVSALAFGAFSKPGPAWLALIYPFLWLFPLRSSMRHLRHRLSVGRTTFEPVVWPASPGGALRGAITLERPPPQSALVRLTVSCEKRSTNGSVKASKTTTETVWKHEESVPPETITRALSGCRLPVDVMLPDDAPQSGDSTESPITHSVKYEWRLELRVPGTPIRSTFELPVWLTR